MTTAGEKQHSAPLRAGPRSWLGVCVALTCVLGACAPSPMPERPVAGAPVPTAVSERPASAPLWVSA